MREIDKKPCFRKKSKAAELNYLKITFLSDELPISKLK